MIYSVNFIDMAEKLSPLVVCKYLEQTDWNKYPFKRKDINVYQTKKDSKLIQVTVPMNRELYDFKEAMYEVVKSIARFEDKSLEQVMLYLLNPNADIIKIRLQKKEVEAGNILFDDAIKLYDNARKLIAATAQDIINPKKHHTGRVDGPVQEFLNQCRFGQTEIGSYVVSVVCPFAEISEDKECKQLSIFTEEERCADSLTRKVTNRLLNNIAYIRKSIDNGNSDALYDETSGISSNFLEALTGLTLQSDNAIIDFIPEWSPNVKENRSSLKSVRITSDYYQPIVTVVDRIKEYTNHGTEILGRISQLTAAPTVDKREFGTVKVVFLDDNNKARTVTVKLLKDDYEKAVEAHRNGDFVKIIGDLTGTNRSLKMDKPSFSVVN